MFHYLHIHLWSSISTYHFWDHLAMISNILLQYFSFHSNNSFKWTKPHFTALSPPQCTNLLRSRSKSTPSQDCSFPLYSCFSYGWYFQILYHIDNYILNTWLNTFLHGTFESTRSSLNIHSSSPCISHNHFSSLLLHFCSSVLRTNEVKSESWKVMVE